jgi:hypothetical protein
VASWVAVKALNSSGRKYETTLGRALNSSFRTIEDLTKLVTVIGLKDNGRDAIVSREEFLARGLRFANGKARELGWFE